MKIVKPNSGCRAMTTLELLLLNVIVFVLFCFLFMSAVEYFALHPWQFLALVAVFLIVLFSYRKTDDAPSFIGFCVFLWGLIIFIGITFICVKKVGQFLNTHPWIFWLGLGAVTGCFFTFLFFRSRKK
jgi:hypothetical protein